MISNIESVAAPRHVNENELAQGLTEIRQSPKQIGTLVLIVARPAGEQRLCLKQADLSPDDGLVGDRWRATSWLKRSDGSPDPAVQITLMNSRCIELIAGDQSHWPLAGDNLFVDFDLSAENLPVGTRLRIGECLLEISEPPHTGCAKFNRRFGAAALKFVNSAEGKALRLRGVHAAIIEGGVVAVGDRVETVPPKATQPS
jgi:MOSC domain-containing protein YiiM